MESPPAEASRSNWTGFRGWAHSEDLRPTRPNRGGQSKSSTTAAEFGSWARQNPSTDMARYEQISRDWFTLLHPSDLSYEEFESGVGVEDRQRTCRLFEKMRDEVSNTARRLLGIGPMDGRVESLDLLDEALTARVAESWMNDSDPQDPNNEFKLTVSEFAVYFGDVVVAALGADWHYARAPNFFQSTVRAAGTELLVFDTVMKKVSDDFGQESLRSKFEAFRVLITERAS